MTDEQFKQLMKKLEDIERQLQAGTWMPQRTYPMQPTPIFQPAYYPGYGPPNWNQVTD